MECNETLVGNTLEQNEILCQNKRNKFLNCLKSHFNLMKEYSAEHKKLLDRILILSTKLNVIER